MTEGSNGALDMPQQRQYQEKPLSSSDRKRIEGRMRGYPAGIEVVVNQLRDHNNQLGKRFAIMLGSYGRSATSEEALIQTEKMVNDARTGRTFQDAKTPDDLKWLPYYQVKNFDPEEIGHVQ